MKKTFFLAALAIGSVMSYGANIRFEKITNAGSLQNNDSVILVYETGLVANGEAGSKQLSSVAMTINGAGEVEIEEQTAKNSYLRLIKSGDNWKIQRGSTYMRYHKSEYITFDSSDGNTSTYTSTWTIKFNGTNVLLASTAAENWVFRCNTDGTPFFRIYKSGYGNDVQLYRLIPNQAISVTKVELDKTELSKRVGDEAVTLVATVSPSNATDKSVTWGSTNTSVATVANGTVNFVGVGEAKIWVKTTFEEKTDTCFVTVRPALNTTEVTYKAVQKADYLSAGAKVFFGTSKDSKNHVMGLYESGNNIKSAAATYGTNRHDVKAQLAYAYTVEKDGNYYLFKDQDGNYLRCEGEKKLKSSATKDDQCKWELGEFDQDDATVQLKSVYYTTYSYYVFNNHSADMFSTYGSVGDGTNLAKTILYSSEAPDWEEREKHPSIVVSGEQLKQENGEYLLDWGKQEKADNPSEDIWADSRKFTVTVTDLPEDAAVVLTADETFYCGWDVIKANRTTPAEITVFWEASKKGVYTGKLLITCDTLPTITINLHAEAVDQDTDPEYQPQIEVSAKTIYLNPNEENNYSDLQGFTFSVSNLAKKMYCKWQHTSSVLFDDESKNANMEILVGEDYLPLNGTLQFEPGQDYKDVEVLISADDLKNGESCDTKIWFYSYAAGSKEDLVIDETVTIRVRASKAPQEDPGDPTPDDPTPDDPTPDDPTPDDPTPDDPTPDDPTPDDPDDGDDQAIDDVNAQTSVQKIVRDRQVYILRNGVLYTVTGAEVRE